MPLKINLKSVLLYAIYACAALFANCAVKGVPLSMGLLFSMLLCGANIIATPVIYVLAAIVNLNLTASLLSLFEAAFLSVIVFLYRRTGRKIRAEGIIYIIIALTPYVVFASWSGSEGIFSDNEYAMKAIAAAVVLLFTFFCVKSVYALLFRVERCRLKEDEFVCIGVVYAVCGAGLYALAGQAVYYCFAAAATVYAVRLTRSPASLIVALTVAIPPAFITLNAEPLTAYVIISVAALLFSGMGKFAAGTVCAPLTAAYMYTKGCFDCPVPLIVLYAVLLFFACFIPSLPKASYFDNLKKRLLVTDILPDTAVMRTRRRTGERLYRISEVFREIECAFTALDEDADENEARERICAELKSRCCASCEKTKTCAYTSVYTGFKKLVDAGSLKGKVNLIDLPSEITANCSHPSEVLSALNALLAEYRRYTVETENARSGRKLLAEQARGVAEVMKDCAVAMSRSQNELAAAADGVKKALAARGISCPEIYLDGENGEEVLTVTVGKVDRKIMCEALSETLKRRYVLKDKLDYDGEKSCLVFGAPPKLDAAFGVAYAIKNGEKVSGDTHSVIKVNNHSFLMVLSDGMGSGVYAHKVSEAAISLIEAFYRAEMPQEPVLNTINKLLTFNRDERFTCLDIAAIDLNSGRADFVKIGSPAGVIMREGEIKILENSSLPLGILDSLKPAVCSETLKGGDIVVFMSDGITSAFPSNTELYEFLRGLKPLNPQNLADKILDGALENVKRVANDDMTVLCVRLFDNA